MCKAGGACAGTAAFTAEANEDGLCAGGGNAGGTRVGEARDATDGNSRTSACDRVEEINILRAEISDDELRTVGRKSETAKAGIGRWAARRLNRRKEEILLQVENVDVIDVGEIDALAGLIVNQEFVETRL